MFTTRSFHTTALVAFACLALLVAAMPAAAQPQDLRAPDNVAAAQSQDLRSPDAAAAAQPSTPSQAPAVHAASGGGVSALTIALGIAGSLLALGGIVALSVHVRRLGRVHIA